MTDVVVQRRAEVLDLRLADVHFPSTNPEFEERAEVTEEEEDPVADEPGTANRHDQRPHPQLRARHHTPHRRCRSRHAYPLPRSCTRAGSSRSHRPSRGYTPMSAPLRQTPSLRRTLGELRFDTRALSSSDRADLPIGAEDCSTERRVGMTRESPHISAHSPVAGKRHLPS